MKNVRINTIAAVIITVVLSIFMVGFDNSPSIVVANDSQSFEIELAFEFDPDADIDMDWDDYPAFRGGYRPDIQLLLSSAHYMHEFSLLVFPGRRDIQAIRAPPKLPS